LNKTCLDEVVAGGHYLAVDLLAGLLGLSPSEHVVRVTPAKASVLDAWRREMNSDSA
jgi:hypothetical protein